MKVVYLLNIFPKISETFILNEMIQMQNKGVQVEVYAHEKVPEAVVHSQVSRIQEVRYFPKMSLFRALAAHAYWLFHRPMGYLRAWSLVIAHGSKIRKQFFLGLYDTVLIHQRNPDHVHAHYGDDSSNLAMLYSVLSGDTFSFTTHMHDIFDFPAPNFPLKSRLAKKHVTISNYNKRYLVDKLGVNESDVTVIHCGVDFDRIPENVSFLPKSHLIFCAARLHEDKSLDILLKACKILMDRGVEFECKIAGEGHLRPALEGMIRQLGLENRVKLLGNQTQLQVFEHLKNSRVKALSSHTEGIPVSLMEAMALKVPVVATRINGIPELIEDGQSGFLVESGNEAQLADRIQKIFEDPQLSQTFVENGYRKVFAEFNLKNETDKLLAMWKS